MNSPEEMGNGPVIHDRRRIDPVTGQVREPDRSRGKHAASEPGGFARNDSEQAQGPRRGRGAEPQGSAPGPAPDAPNGRAEAGPHRPEAERGLRPP